MRISDWSSDVCSSDLESLAFYAYREPKAAKQLHIGVIPKAVDEYLQMRGNYAAQEPDKKLGNPVHHVHVARGKDVPQAVVPVRYCMLPNPDGGVEADGLKGPLWRVSGQ